MGIGRPGRDARGRRQRSTVQLRRSFNASQNPRVLSCATIPRRATPFAPRQVSKLAAFATALALGSPARAAKIEVRGGAKIEARARPVGAGVAIAGALHDETGAPIPSARVTMELVQADGGGTVPDAMARPGSLALPPPEPCASSAPVKRSSAKGGTYELETDEAGAFCVRTSTALGRAIVRLRYAGGPLYDATSDDLSVDPAGRDVALRLLPDAPVVSLDRDALVWTAVARIGAADAVPAPRESLALTLADERGQKLGAETTDAAGEARFELSASTLGVPGPGELRLDFAGAGDLAPAHLVRTIERHASVRVAAVAGATRGTSEDGIPIHVGVTWRGGDVPNGTVEALLGGDSVGAGTVADGRATVVVTFASAGAREADVTLRYVPDAPFWEPGPPAVARVTLAAPSAWRKAPLALVAIAVAWWVLRGWRRMPQPKARGSLATSMPTGEPAVALVQAGRATEGWRGSVIDAHDGSAIAHASVAVVVPTFAGETIAATARTDGAGRFVLAPLPVERGARLRVEAPWHAAIEQALPPAGELAIGMVSRRRKLLDRLVEWTRRAGAAWQPSPEPTPGQVARIAERLNAGGDASAAAPSPERVQAWARALEHAAYGEAPVDAAAERDVDALEPRHG